MLVRFIELTLVKNVINGGQFGQNRSFLMKMVKIGSFWGPKLRNRSKFGKSGQKNCSLIICKNYLSQVYGHTFGQKCH